MSKIKFYAVRKGRKPGIYETWEECQRQVIHFKGQEYKSFSTMQEAKEYFEAAQTANKPDIPAPVSLCPAGIPQDDTKHYDIFTDGSYLDGRYSWAFAAYQKKKLIHTAKARGTRKWALSAQNVVGELEAVEEAVKWAEEQGATSIIIYHDYKGPAEWAYGNWKANKELTQKYVEFIKSRLGWIRFAKVAAHTGIKENEMVDKLAKEALSQHG